MLLRLTLLLDSLIGRLHLIIGVVHCGAIIRLVSVGGGILAR